jgi:hypothetical protein
MKHALGFRIVFAVISLAAWSACAPPTPILAKLASPVLAAQRRMSGPLLVVLTYDDTKTPCGAVDFLHATLDGAAIGGNAGQRIVDEKTGAVTCAFPNFTVTPSVASTPREIVVTDDVTSISMTVDSLDVGSASADFPPATLHPGYALQWSATLPSVGTSSWNVAFTPNGGTAVIWDQGAAMQSSFSVTVPAVTAAATGSVAATWLVKSTITKCEGGASCEATIQGAGSFTAVVAP